MFKSFTILALSALLLFLVGPTLSAPPALNEPENNENDLTLVLLARLNHLEAKVVRLETELEDEKGKNRLQEMEISNLKQSSAQHLPKMVKKNKEVGADGRAVLFPRSCRELAGNGHSIDGIYLIEFTPTRIGAVFCEFVSGSSPVEIQIGLVDIKSAPVHFYVSRRSDYGSVNTVIPYQVTHLNIGNAMDVGSGVFTAPLEGVYHFQFSAYGTGLRADLRLNGAYIGRGACTDGDTCSIQSTLKLRKGENVAIYLGEATLHDSSEQLTHFTGWLDEEELTLS